MLARAVKTISITFSLFRCPEFPKIPPGCQDRAGFVIFGRVDLPRLANFYFCKEDNTCLRPSISAETTPFTVSRSTMLTIL